MGNTCSKRQQSDSVRVQENNSSDKQSDVWGRLCIFNIPGAPQIWKIGYRVIKIDRKFTITIFVIKPKLKVDGTTEFRIVAVCFFKIEKSPSKIEFKKLENDGFSITTYISDETSREIVIHSISWESNQYNVCKEDGVFLECVKKIQRTDCSSLFVSDLHPSSLSAQHASATGGGNESSTSEEVSSSNGPQIEVSEQVRLVQGVSTVSQTDGSLEVASTQVTSLVFESDIDTVALSASQTDESATLAPEVFEGNNGAKASALQANVQRLLVDSQTDGSVRPVEVSEDILSQISETYKLSMRLLETTYRNVSGGGNSAVKDVNGCQDFAQCGPPPSLKNASGPVQVTQFFGKDATFSVSEDRKSIEYRTSLEEKKIVSLGIVKDTIKKIEVYEISFGIYLILIHATDGIVHVCGYTNQRTAKSLTSIPVNQSFSESAKRIFEKIEFLPPKTAHDGSELRSRDVKLVFSNSFIRTFNVSDNGELIRTPNF
jgi:hypothetical protein